MLYVVFIILSFTSLGVVPAYNATIYSEPIIVNATIVTPQKDEPIITTSLGVSLIAVAVSTGGLVYTGKKFSKDAKIHELALLKGIQDELEELEMSDERNSKKDYAVFAVQYLNTLDRLAFLGIKGYINNDLIEYFRPNFSAALGILSKDEFKNRIRENIYLMKWTKENNVSTGDAP